MIEASVMLLSEWQDQQQKGHASWPSKVRLQLFGSLLDHKSLELAWVMANSSFDGEDPDHPLFLQIVLFPICRSMRINQKLKQEVQHLLQTPLNKPHYHPAIMTIVKHAWDVVDRMRQTYHAQLLDILVHPRPPNTPQFLENRILFGNLSAQFLTKMTLFPHVRINNRVYNGIPFGFDIESFVQLILKNELMEKCETVGISPFLNVELQGESHREKQEKEKPMGRLELPAT